MKIIKRILSTGFYLLMVIVYVLLIVQFIHTKKVDVGIWCILLYLVMSSYEKRIDSEEKSRTTCQKCEYACLWENGKITCSHPETPDGEHIIGATRVILHQGWPNRPGYCPRKDLE